MHSLYVGLEKGITMKNIPLLILIAFVIPCWASGIDATKSELSADDIASYLNIRHNTFTFEHDHSESVNKLKYRILLYEKGKIIHNTGWASRTYPTNTTHKRTERITIFHKYIGDFIEVVVKSNKGSSRYKIDTSKSIMDYPITDGSLHFDDENRLILAYEVEKDSDGVTRVTDENSTIEGASAALVFQLETK